MLRLLRNISLTWWIFIGMAAGILIGYFASESAARRSSRSPPFSSG